MKKKFSVEDFEKEYSSEIEEEFVSVEDLKKFKVSLSSLKLEIYLRNIYGDDIISNISSDDFLIGAKKSIEKVDLTQVGTKSLLQNLSEDIDNSDFDKEFDAILSNK